MTGEDRERNLALLRNALGRMCGLNAEMTCYLNYGWEYDPGKALRELEQIAKLIAATQPDGEDPKWLTEAAGL
jgi:hypothetical protein